MRRFIARVSLFAVILLGLLSYIEYNLSYVVTSYNKQRTYLERQLDSIEILVLGDSHASYGVDPTVFSRKGFNLANVSQDFYYNEQLMNKYIDKIPNLKIVIIDVSDFSLWYRLNDGPEVFRETAYLLSWDIPPISFRRDWGRYSRILHYSPRVAMQCVLDGFHVDMAPTMEESGWMPPESEGYWRFVTEQMGQQRFALRKTQVHEYNFAPNLQMLTLLVKNLRAQRLQVVLTLLPSHKTYYTQSDKTWHDKTLLILGDLSSQYDSILLDYFRDNRFVTEDFFDSDHLNRHGAQKFSRILDHDLNTFLLLDRNQSMSGNR